MAELSKEDVFGGEHFLNRLLVELEAMYPHSTPKPSDDLSVIMYRAGQRSVVNYIKAKNEPTD